MWVLHLDNADRLWKLSHAVQIELEEHFRQLGIEKLQSKVKFAISSRLFKKIFAKPTDRVAMELTY